MALNGWGVSGSKDVATDGYSFCIDGAELLTPREYLKRAHDDYSKYGIVDTKTKLKDADITCVIAVKMRVRNKTMSKAELKRMFGIWCRSLRQTMTLWSIPI